MPIRRLGTASSGGTEPAGDAVARRCTGEFLREPVAARESGPSADSWARSLHN